LGALEDLGVVGAAVLVARLGAGLAATAVEGDNNGGEDHGGEDVGEMHLDDGDGVVGVCALLIGVEMEVEDCLMEGL
jgi:hypothetical protein